MSDVLKDQLNVSLINVPMEIELQNEHMGTIKTKTTFTEDSVKPKIGQKEENKKTKNPNKNDSKVKENQKKILFNESSKKVLNNLDKKNLKRKSTDQRDQGLIKKLKDAESVIKDLKTTIKEKDDEIKVLRLRNGGLQDQILDKMEEYAARQINPYCSRIKGDLPIGRINFETNKIYCGNNFWLDAPVYFEAVTVAASGLEKTRFNRYTATIARKLFGTEIKQYSVTGRACNSVPDSVPRPPLDPAKLMAIHNIFQFYCEDVLKKDSVEITLLLHKVNGYISTMITDARRDRGKKPKGPKKNPKVKKGKKNLKSLAPSDYESDEILKSKEESEKEESDEDKEENDDMLNEESDIEEEKQGGNDSEKEIPDENDSEEEIADENDSEEEIADENDSEEEMSKTNDSDEDADSAQKKADEESVQSESSEDEDN
ncbi:glutamic acid-rich protein-like [Trichogramma pretiosum]|uniref:glutamic acid-rich protein-like n=1 Tax=Trichogramma pretiosum TaxID=7493 RepID=UPI000C71B15D|nr:glutamic acid-rich protein-like [Trichogramma pretiosum]